MSKPITPKSQVKNLLTDKIHFCYNEFFGLEFMMKPKQLNDYSTYKSRPSTPLVAIRLDDTLAVKRLIQHTSKRVIKEHKDTLERLAYR